jgi:hypothetical protein
MPLSNGQ